MLLPASGVSPGGGASNSGSAAAAAAAAGAAPRSASSSGCAVGACADEPPWVPTSRFASLWFRISLSPADWNLDRLPELETAVLAC